MSSSRKPPESRKKRKAAEPSYIDTEIAALEAMRGVGEDSEGDGSEKTEPDESEEKE